MAEIVLDEWYEDEEGRTWAVQAVDVAAQTVRLRLVHPPELVVSIGELETRFKENGLRVINARMKALDDAARARRDREKQPPDEPPSTE